MRQSGRRRIWESGKISAGPLELAGNTTDDFIGGNLTGDASWRAGAISRGTISRQTGRLAPSFFDFQRASGVRVCESQSRDDNARDHIVQQRCSAENKHEWRDHQPDAHDQGEPAPSRLIQAPADQREPGHQRAGDEISPDRFRRLDLEDKWREKDPDAQQGV